MTEINKTNTRLWIPKFRTIVIMLMLVIGATEVGTSQRFNSLVGGRAGYKTGALSIKIALDNINHLEGTIGVMTPQPDYTAGAGVAYHRHISLNDSRNLQFYYGASIKGVIGDEQGFGNGIDLGLLYIFNKISFGVDLFPTYFYNDVLGFRPLWGINLRWVND